ncbi:3096_t:CDS:2, partial [Rhizophagus irregularis]
SQYATILENPTRFDAKEFRNPKSTYSPAITKPKPPRPKSPSPSHVIKDVPVTELPMFR